LPVEVRSHERFRRARRLQDFSTAVFAPIVHITMSDAKSYQNQQWEKDRNGKPPPTPPLGNFFEARDHFAQSVVTF
jgi:hypothetical protein